MTYRDLYNLDFVRSFEGFKIRKYCFNKTDSNGHQLGGVITSMVITSMLSSFLDYYKDHIDNLLRDIETGLKYYDRLDDSWKMDGIGDVFIFHNKLILIPDGCTSFTYSDSELDSEEYFIPLSHAKELLLEWKTFYTKIF